MSGIVFGYLWKDKNRRKELAYDMTDYMQEYKIDKYRILKHKNLFIGCGLQYITEENYDEVLPYYDKKENLIITADAIIDNRKELLQLFELTNNDVGDFSDSEYILMAYSKWGKKCCDYLLGDYSFVIYDTDKEELFCARDHVGKRTFYYIENDDVIAFSTVEKPLLPLIKDKDNLNERWITDYLALLGAKQNIDCKETIYNGIYELEPAHTITFSKMGSMNNCYWDPVKNIKPLKFKSEEEYISEFLKIFSEAVNCRVRTNGKVGIKLSGGLDSSSVAAIASNTLKKQGKRLISFTSVPISNFINNAQSYSIPDETNEVKELARFLSNIDTHFCSCEGINSTTNIDELIYLLEQPYKVVENSTWLYEINKIAQDNNIKVMLSGQYGNTTISFGHFFIHEKTLIKKGHIIKAIKEINIAGNRHNVPRKKILKDVIKTFSSYDRKVKRFLIKNPTFSRFEYTPVNRELIKKWNVEERFDKFDCNPIVSRDYTYDEIRKLRSDPTAFVQYGLFDTKLALAFGLVNRDPTRDKRIIEFCLSIPSDLYVKDGIERYLIRKSMEGRLPDCIRMNLYKRGLQSADWIQRLLPVWKDVYEELGEAIKDDDIKKYIHVDYMIDIYKSLEEINLDSDKLAIRMCLIVYILYRYILINRRGFKKTWLLEENDVKY